MKAFKGCSKLTDVFLSQAFNETIKETEVFHNPLPKIHLEEATVEVGDPWTGGDVVSNSIYASTAEPWV